MANAEEVKTSNNVPPHPYFSLKFGYGGVIATGPSGGRGYGGGGFGFSGIGAIGIQKNIGVNSNLRTEIEYVYSAYTKTGYEYKPKIFLCNLYFDFITNDNMVRPYIGFGLGRGDFVRISHYSYGSSRTEISSKIKIAFGIHFGVAVNITDKTYIDFGFCYLSWDMRKQLGEKAFAHKIDGTIGIRYVF